jgi:hypothetical protein
MSPHRHDPVPNPAQLAAYRRLLRRLFDERPAEESDTPASERHECAPTPSEQREDDAEGQMRNE